MWPPSESWPWRPAASESSSWWSNGEAADCPQSDGDSFGIGSRRDRAAGPDERALRHSCAFKCRTASTSRSCCARDPDSTRPAWRSFGMLIARNGPPWAMRDAPRTVLVVLAIIAVSVGTVVSLRGFEAPPQPRTVVGEATFPDYSSGQLGSSAANEVRLRVTLLMSDPWIQGERHPVTATVDAEPGSGVSAVDLVTMILSLKRPAMPYPQVVGADLDLLAAQGGGRWVPAGGPMTIYPNEDIVGSDFFFTFAISLNVDYTNGRSYGFGGWSPDTRIVSPPIVPNLTPIGLLLIMAGIACATLAVLPWQSIASRTPTAAIGTPPRP